MDKKKIVAIIIIILIVFAIGGYITIKNLDKPQNLAEANKENKNTKTEENLAIENNNENIEGAEQDNEVKEIKIKVGNEILNMKLEQNEATRALVEKLKQGDITVNTSEYGSFEQTGDLGFSLPKNDTQIKTKVGDVMLYQGNQISIFYGSNSWSYTKLGEITNKTESELKNILGISNATLVLSIN